eukprot:Opistho-2@9787
MIAQCDRAFMQPHPSRDLPRTQLAPRISLPLLLLHTSLPLHSALPSLGSLALCIGALTCGCTVELRLPRGFIIIPSAKLSLHLARVHRKARTCACRRRFGILPNNDQLGPPIHWRHILEEIFFRLWGLLNLLLLLRRYYLRLLGVCLRLSRRDKRLWQLPLRRNSDGRGVVRGRPQTAGIWRPQWSMRVGVCSDVYNNSRVLPVRLFRGSIARGQKLWRRATAFHVMPLIPVIRDASVHCRLVAMVSRKQCGVCLRRPQAPLEPTAALADPPAERHNAEQPRGQPQQSHCARAGHWQSRCLSLA